MISLILLIFFAFLISGTPIAFSLVISATIFLYFGTTRPLEAIVQQMFTAADSFPLMAIPFFLLAGELMNVTGITNQLVAFANILIGWIRGGLAQVNILVSMLFAGITGSAIADTAAIGSILIPSMKEEGFDADFSAAITAASSVIGPIIPPSIIMVVYGSTLNISIGAMFAAGILPGILVGLGLMVAAFIVSGKRKYPTHKFDWRPKTIANGLKEAFFALLMPLIILGGILSGVFTATEAGAVAVLYALIVGLFIFRSLKFKDIYTALLRTAITTSTIMLLVSVSNPFGWVLSIQQIPQLVASSLLSISEQPLVILILMNILLLIAGMFIETTANVLILAPILMPIAISVGIDPLHFAMIMIVNLIIGLITPPLGLCLFVAAPIAEITIERLSISILPYLFVEILVLLLITIFPKISLFIPSLLGF
ncbi:MAG: TRAP-type transport system large permease protein [Clostridia bacterium]|jgi:tripartite ATP-independent transporter DctM subunit|nr:TRAP-type transport system large permease protein [Clostridia bacterium]